MFVRSVKGEPAPINGVEPFVRSVKGGPAPINGVEPRSVTYVSGPDNVKFGGRHGIRTHDPHVANVVLSQLS